MLKSPQAYPEEAVLEQLLRAWPLNRLLVQALGYQVHQILQSTSPSMLSHLLLRVMAAPTAATRPRHLVLYSQLGGALSAGTNQACRRGSGAKRHL